MLNVAWVAPRFLACAVATVAGLLAYVSAFQNTWIDDAYIQLRYARTLAEHGTWGFYAGYPANTATSPLNVLLLAAAAFPLRSVEWAATALTALELAALLAVLLMLSRRLFNHLFFGWFAFVAFATNPLLLSTIGMESILYALLLVAAIYFFVVGRWVAMAMTLGLLTLARPDGVLLLAVLLPLASTTLRRKVGMLLVFTATMAPWLLFSWVYLGSFVPDTLVIKLGDAAWGGTTFAEGLPLFLDRFPGATVASLFLAPLCLFPLWKCHSDVIRVVTALVAYGLLHFAIYAAMAVPPYHWYFVPELVPLLLVASLGATYHHSRVREGAIRAWTWAAVGVPAIGLLLLAWSSGFHFTEAPINTNWATNRQYEGMGDWMRHNLTPSDAVAVHGEIGTVSFYSDRYMVDEFSDMSIADAHIKKADYGSLPGIGPLVKLNFLWRRDHTPLPAPTFEFVWVRAAGDAPGCRPEDPACRMAREGTTRWAGRRWFVVRWIGIPSDPLPPPPAQSG